MTIEKQTDYDYGDYVEILFDSETRIRFYFYADGITSSSIDGHEDMPWR